MDNDADRIFAGWPERLYILDEHGIIVYKGEKGPYGYHPEEVRMWLQKRFRNDDRPEKVRPWSEKRLDN